MRFFVISIMVLCCVSTLEALRADAAGVCAVTRSVRKTRLKYYKVKSWCKGKRCLLRKSKVETYKTNQNETMCCSGWSYSSEFDACAPRCSMGCIGGRCVAPEVCKCDPPAAMHPQHSNICLTCDPPCENATCVNNTCICLEGYVKINNTCQPVCDSCVNGQCIGPNNCECLPGYIYNEGCKPQCDNCDNGVCSVPNVCSCEEGYLRNRSGCYKQCPKDCKSCDSNGICKDGVCNGNPVCIIHILTCRWLCRWYESELIRRCSPLKDGAMSL